MSICIVILIDLIRGVSLVSSYFDGGNSLNSASTRLNCLRTRESLDRSTQTAGSGLARSRARDTKDRNQIAIGGDNQGRRNMANDEKGSPGTWETLPSPSKRPAGDPAYQLQVDPQPAS